MKYFHLKKKFKKYTLWGSRATRLKKNLNLLGRLGDVARASVGHVAWARIMHRRRRKRSAETRDDDLSKMERVCEELRKIQWQTNCSTKALQQFLNSLRGKLGEYVKELDELPVSVKFADKKMQHMVCMHEHARQT